MFKCPEQPRILLVRLSAFGDVVQTLPILAWLKQHWPQAHIGWLVEAEAASLLDNHPLIATLHVAQRKTWLQQLKHPAQWLHTLKAIHTFKQELQAQKYDAAIDVQGLLKSAVWPFWAGVPVRVGFKPGRELSHWFYTHTAPSFSPVTSTLHATLEFCSLLRVLGVPSPAQTSMIPFPLPASAQQPDLSSDAAQEFTTWLQVQSSRVVVALAPATLWPSKHWPASHWAQLLALLAATNRFSVVWVGGTKDKALQAQIEQQAETLMPNFEQRLPTYQAMGVLPLAAWFYWLAQVNGFVGQDSAPLHMANAVASQPQVNQPYIVGLYGSTSAKRTGPTAEGLSVALQTELPCQPCHERLCPLGTMACMQQLTPQQVFFVLQSRFFISP